MGTNQSSPPIIGIFHLVRKGNPFTHFEHFMNSLHQTKTDLVWQLVLIFKGFTENDDLTSYLNLTSNIPTSYNIISDTGVDLTAYKTVAGKHSFEYIVCFNSFSQIFSPKWLDYYWTAIQNKNAGIVGATASYESSSGVLFYFMLRKSKFLIPLKFIKYLFFKVFFPDFPNPHLRTNAFMIRRVDYITLCPRIVLKFQAYLFESGRCSLTRKMIKAGKEVILIDKTGKSFSLHQFHLAKVFRQKNQEQLLVSDNQTRAFQNASENNKKQLTLFSWGHHD